MTAPFFHGSPRQDRWLADRRRMFRAATVGIGDQVLASVRSEEMRRIDKFRATELAPHRRQWFDLLSHDDQCRIACPRVDRRSDDQKDYDATDSFHGWPEN